MGRAIPVTSRRLYWAAGTHHSRVCDSRGRRMDDGIRTRGCEVACVAVVLLVQLCRLRLSIVIAAARRSSRRSFEFKLGFGFSALHAHWSRTLSDCIVFGLWLNVCVESPNLTSPRKQSSVSGLYMREGRGALASFLVQSCARAGRCPCCPSAPFGPAAASKYGISFFTVSE